jgi:hypothetical protein
MDNIQLQPGIYTNIFPVILPKEQVTIMAIERAKAVDLRPLLVEISSVAAQVQIYAYKDYVYGYGKDAMSFLAPKGFRETQVDLLTFSALGAHLVIDGIVSLALDHGFWQRKSFSPRSVIGRTEILEPQPAGVISQGSIKIFAGYDLRCTYHEAVESLGMIVDVIWAYQSKSGTFLNPRQMREYNAMSEALIIQDELLRGTNRVNSQISQIRMHRYILPFVQKFQSVPLPCGSEAHINPIPFQVIL